MSITRLKKITLCGLLKEKQEILKDLQTLGCMHLLPLSPPPAEVEKAATPRADAAYKALRFLTDAPQKRRQITHDPGFDIKAFIHDTLDLKQNLRDATDRRDFLENRIAAVEPWGDIYFPPKEALEGLRLWFYQLPLRKLDSLNNIDTPWQIVRKDHRYAYIVLIAEKEPADDFLPVQRTHVGELSLNDLKMHLEEDEIKLEDLAAQKQALTRYLYLLNLNIAEVEDQASLAYVEQQTLDDDAIITVQGWVPVDAVERIEAYTEEARLACLIEEPTSDDEPPTLIEQSESMGAGVDLTMFYQVPNYRSWDPTLMLVVSFSIFFAMILADTGYGLIMLVGLLAFWGRLGHSRKGRAYRLLGSILTGCTVAYGVIVGSYFGLSPQEGSLLEKLHILNVGDFDSMMKISIIIGVIHIGFANAMMAFINRRRLIMLSSIGWIATTTGGLIYWLATADSNGFWQIIGTGLTGIGLLLIVLFSSDRPIIKTSDHAWRLFDGIKSLTRLVGAFGDVLSYMRLFALGLASASLAMTFNDLASSAHEAMPGLGFLAGCVILLIGHTLNLGLSLMSGVVHGLRLNFIEFYKWGLPEEGTAFQRFARKEVQK